MVKVNGMAANKGSEKITSLQSRKKGLIATGASGRRQKEMEPFRQLPWGSQCRLVKKWKQPLLVCAHWFRLLPEAYFLSLCLQLFTQCSSSWSGVNLCLRCLVQKGVALLGEVTLASQQDLPVHLCHSVLPSGLNSFQISPLPLTQSHSPTLLSSSLPCLGHCYTFSTLFLPPSHRGYISQLSLIFRSIDLQIFFVRETLDTFPNI